MARTSKTQFVVALTGWVHVFMQQSMQGFLSHARANNLSMSQVGTLMYIERMGACGVSDISDDLGVSNAAVSQLLDRLVEGGLVERRENPEDRRAKRIELTARGRAIIHGTVEARQRWFRDLASELSEDERTATINSLSLMAERARSIHEPDPKQIDPEHNQQKKRTSS